MRKLNKTEEAIKEAVIHRMAGPLLGGRSVIFSMVAYGSLNGYSLAQVEAEAEKHARRIYRESKRKKKRK